MVFKVVPYDEFLAMDQDGEPEANDGDPELPVEEFLAMDQDGETEPDDGDPELPLEMPQLSCNLLFFSAFGQRKWGLACWINGINN